LVELLPPVPVLVPLPLPPWPTFTPPWPKPASSSSPELLQPAMAAARDNASVEERNPTENGFMLDLDEKR